jgi:hypothetical protein
MFKTRTSILKTSLLGFAIATFTSAIFMSAIWALPAASLERAAPASSIAFDAAEKQDGFVDVPGVTLNPRGDWSLFLVTKSVAGNYATGTVLSIGAPSNTLFTDKSHFSLTWCAQYPAAWKLGRFANTFVVTARDDAGASASRRQASGDQLFGQWNVSPLVGQAGFDDNRAHGLAVQRRGGTIEFWSVDESGARLMDKGAAGDNFGGIANQPMRIGGALLKTQPEWPFTFWKQPVQALVIDNGGCLTPGQMARLFAGADARDVLQLQAARDDRYYPGTITNGQLDELVGGKRGTISGSIAVAASLLPTPARDDVLVDMDGYGQVAPVVAGRVRFWGTRVGGATDIRMRVVKWGAPEPIIDDTQIIVPWATVARKVANGPWRGDVAGVTRGFADYDCEVSWRDAKGWSVPKRLHRRWSPGVVVGIGGQSIVQKMRDDGGPQRSFDPKVDGFLRAYYDLNQGTAGYQDNISPQGWMTRWTPRAPQTSRDNFGENRMAEKLALLANSAVGVGNFAVGGSPIREYLGDTDRWARWERFIQRARPQFGIWGNGQGDVGISREARFEALDRLLAQYDRAVQSAPGGSWKYTFYIFPLNGDWGVGGNGDGIRSYDAEWAQSRAAQGKPVGVLAFVLDEKTEDGTHMADDDSGLGVLASRMAQTLAHGLGVVPFSGLGPQIDRKRSSWTTRDGVTTIDLVATPNGGTSLQTAGGGAPSGFQISIDGGAFSMPASAAIVDATHIRLTANGVAGKSVSVTYQAGAPGSASGRDVSKAQAGTDNAVYDNRGDNITGLPGYPLAPIPGSNALQVATASQPNAMR